jgi:hypothetical protein
MTCVALFYYSKKLCSPLFFKVSAVALDMSGLPFFDMAIDGGAKEV